MFCCYIRLHYLLYHTASHSIEIWKSCYPILTGIIISNLVAPSEYLLITHWQQLYLRKFMWRFCNHPFFWIQDGKQISCIELFRVLLEEAGLEADSGRDEKEDHLSCATFNNILCIRIHRRNFFQDLVLGIFKFRLSDWLVYISCTTAHFFSLCIACRKQTKNLFFLALG